MCHELFGDLFDCMLLHFRECGFAPILEPWLHPVCTFECLLLSVRCLFACICIRVLLFCLRRFSIGRSTDAFNHQLKGETGALYSVVESDLFDFYNGIDSLHTDRS